MKQLSIIFSLLLLFAACKTKKAVVVEGKEDNSVYEAPDVFPQYPGGEKARQMFIVKNLVYPPLAIESGKQGKIFVKFIVEKDGSVSNAKAVKTFDDACANESIRVINLMKWEPAKHKGKIVRSAMILPIIFKLR